jgi:alpha-D-xyloside xylohydrolase
MKIPSVRQLAKLFLLTLPFFCATTAYAQRAFDSPSRTVLKSGELTMIVSKPRFRYSFMKAGSVVVGPHPVSGLVFDGAPIGRTRFAGCSDGNCKFSVTATDNISAQVIVSLTSNHVRLQIQPATSRPLTILARTAGASPGFGLGDNGVEKRHGEYTTDITGYSSDHFLSGGHYRLISNFAIYPSQGFAEVLIDPHIKDVSSSQREIVQGVQSARAVTDLYYFFGNPHVVYRTFLGVRNRKGYRVFLPKYQFFGVGWESWGALAWNTNQQTITESVNRYLSLGYPLQWMIIGSGFWPHSAPGLESTTSFGMWDRKLYPHPKALIDHFHKRGLKVMLGLRICFLTDGPFSREGIEHGYFIEKNGEPEVFRLRGWPKTPCYLLNGQKPAAVKWYLQLVKKWTADGIDGFKEDLFGYGQYDLRDDKIDPVNAALMNEGIYIMGRNSYIGSPEDLHRIGDFNYNQDQDRGPVNSLTFAYSGYPLVYPDDVGGTFGESLFKVTVTNRMKAYIMREAQWASLHSSMAMGQAPWKFKDPEVEDVLLKAARLHARLQPYIYSQATRFFHDGYPWTMAPLPLVYPDDKAVYGRENNRVRGYEWMIGDALLATPLYGNDYATARTRDVYLPKGRWIDYDSGKQFVGPKTLKAYPLPIGKTPLFVGGTGIVVEYEHQRLVARLYPVTSNAESVFWFSDGRTESHFRLEAVNWAHPKVRDLADGRPQEGKWVRHAYQFDIQRGHNYLVR